VKTKDQCLAQCQKEYSQWRDEHALWLVEIKKWRRDEQQALALLFRLEQALPDCKSLLDQHYKMIMAHEDRLDTHKKRLAAYQRKDMDDKHYTELMDEHRHEADLHAGAKEAHAKFGAKITATVSDLSHLVRLFLADKEA